MNFYKNILKIERLIYQHNRNYLYLYPMLRVKFTDNNEIIKINNYEELLEIMRSRSYGLESSIHEYMKNYARRAVINNNEDIRATCVSEFIEDLIKYNHIKIM